MLLVERKRQQDSVLPLNSHLFISQLSRLLKMGVTGFEPVTLRLSSACSNQLSYTPESWLREWSRTLESRLRAAFPLNSQQIISQLSSMEAWGFEPQTYSLQSYRSTN